MDDPLYDDLNAALSTLVEKTSELVSVHTEVKERIATLDTFITQSNQVHRNVAAIQHSVNQ
jgi:hypothetical protein